VVVVVDAGVDAKVLASILSNDDDDKDQEKQLQF